MNSKIVLLIVFVAVTGFFACKKDGEKLTADTQNEITVINAGGDTLNVYENGTRINNGSNLLPSGQYTNLAITAGTQRYQFKKAGNPNTLFETELSMNDSTRYTLFVAGQSADRTFLLRDSLYSDTAVLIRYVNASPDAGNIDFTIGDLPTIKSIPFKGDTKFLSIPAGKVFYSMYREGQSTPLASGTITVSAGASYNLFSKGLVDGKGTSALGARLLRTQ